MFTGLALYHFLFRVFLRFFIGVFVVAFFLFSKKAVKWLLLFYVVLILIINPLWFVKPNSAEYYAEIEKIENAPQRAESNETVTITLRNYPFTYIKNIFYILSLLYVFTLRSKLEFKINNLEVETS